MIKTNVFFDFTDFQVPIGLWGTIAVGKNPAGNLSDGTEFLRCAHATRGRGLVSNAYARHCQRRGEIECLVDPIDGQYGRGQYGRG